MNKFVKLQVLVTSLSLCVITFISFWALEKDKCFEIKVEKGLTIKVVNCITTEK